MPTLANGQVSLIHQVYWLPLPVLIAHELGSAPHFVGLSRVSITAELNLYARHVVLVVVRILRATGAPTVSAILNLQLQYDRMPKPELQQFGLRF